MGLVARQDVGGRACRKCATHSSVWGSLPILLNLFDGHYANEVDDQSHNRCRHARSEHRWYSCTGQAILWSAHSDAIHELHDDDRYSFVWWSSMDPVINSLRAGVKQVMEKIHWYLWEQPLGLSARNWRFPGTPSLARNTIDERSGDGNSASTSSTSSELLSFSKTFQESGEMDCWLELLEASSVEKVYYTFWGSSGLTKSLLLVHTNRWILTWWPRGYTTWSTISHLMGRDNQVLINYLNEASVRFIPWRSLRALLDRIMSFSVFHRSRWIDWLQLQSCTFSWPLNLELLMSESYPLEIVPSKGIGPSLSLFILQLVSGLMTIGRTWRSKDGRIDEQVLVAKHLSNTRSVMTRVHQHPSFPSWEIDDVFSYWQYSRNRSFRINAHPPALCLPNLFSVNRIFLRSIH